MTVLVVGEHPDVTAIIERRRALGLDGHDEVWEGIYHMVPHAQSGHGMVESELHAVLRPHARRAGLRVIGAFNLGEATDYRVPDLAVREPGPDAVYLPTARLVIEVLSPDDETFAKFDFYGAHGVAEIMVADPEARSLRLWRWDALSGVYVEGDRSAVLDTDLKVIEIAIEWP
jgi:hypothetical protein